MIYKKSLVVLSGSGISGFVLEKHLCRFLSLFEKTHKKFEYIENYEGENMYIPFQKIVPSHLIKNKYISFERSRPQLSQRKFDAAQKNF